MQIFSEDLRDRYSDKFKHFEVRESNSPDLRPASVVLAITQTQETNEPSVLLTLRPTTLNRHGGQYAFPGGRVDPGETDQEAALRELEEEAGLTIAPSDIIGRLDDFPTRSGFRMRPYVVWAGECGAINFNKDEVEAVFRIPFSELASPEIPILMPSDEEGKQILCAHLPTLGHRIYAPTAAILYQFRELVIMDRVTRVAHYDQPAFARK